MITRKFVIEYDEEIEPYLEQYGSMVRLIYNNLELKCDETFKKSLREKFSLLDEMFVQSAIMDAEGMRNVDDEIKIRDKNTLKELEKLIPKAKHDGQKRNLISRHQKLTSKQSSDYNRVFGKVSVLRNITRYHNILNRRINGSIRFEKLSNRIDKLKTEYRNNRNSYVYVVGKAASKGNRKFEFDFENGEIIFKPSKGIKFSFKISTKNWKSELKLLQERIDTSSIPVTVRLSRDYISISYDEKDLYGFAFDANGYKREKTITSKEEVKALRDRYFAEQMQRMLQNKSEYRYAGIDLNPENIGFSIIDIKSKKVIYRSNYNISNLIRRHNGNSTNKIKDTLGKIYKQIFIMCKHYKVSHFGKEELSFKRANMELNSTSLNRKINNLWCLSYQENLIKKHCNVNGIFLVEVNAAYSSFVGNAVYNDFDSVCSSIEIARRSAICKQKLEADWYPINRILECNLKYVIQEERGCASRTPLSIIKNLYQFAKSQGYRRLFEPSYIVKSSRYKIYQNFISLYV